MSTSDFQRFMSQFFFTKWFILNIDKVLRRLKYLDVTLQICTKQSKIYPQCVQYLRIGSVTAISQIFQPGLPPSGAWRSFFSGEEILNFLSIQCPSLLHTSIWKSLLDETKSVDTAPFSPNFNLQQQHSIYLVEMVPPPLHILSKLSSIKWKGMKIKEGSWRQISP